ncbi:MAG TPA: DUF6152 family protein, partial [Gammaproteobacteria bacterium]|nr:DUF6152 family protein [Gammaproteobacteria bacterium]
RMSTRHAIFGAALGLASVVAHAHHSIAAVYDSSRERRLEAVVAEFKFVNPHPFVIVTVDEDGAEQSWRLEMDNRFELAQVGMTDTTLKRGDRVIVTGSAGRTEPRTLYILRLDRPADGFRYEQVGSRPRVSTVRR